MPANKISYNSDPIEDMIAPDESVHISQHSNAEYETLRKAFLLLGERYDKLSESNDQLVHEYEDLVVEYDNLLDDYEFVDHEYSEMLYGEDE